MNDDIDKGFAQEIGGMIKQIQELTKEAVALVEPEVKYIIRNNVTDSKQIESLLDRLLDYAGMDDIALLLFRRICRHYYFINPKATATYVYAYRDMYDSETDDEDDIND